MNLKGCARLEPEPVSGFWFRAIRQRHWRTRLSTAHSRGVASRYSAEGSDYEILYLAQTHQLALFEVEAMLGNPNVAISNAQHTWTLLNLEVRLQHIANLTRNPQLRILSTNVQELTGDWKRFDQRSMAPTQRLGRALFEMPNLEGVLVPSAKYASTNLVIFPEKLAEGSSICLKNERSGKRECIEGPGSATA